MSIYKISGGLTKIKYQADKPYRVNCTSVKNQSPRNPKRHRIPIWFGLCCKNQNLLYVESERKWVHVEDIKKGVGHCTHFMKINSVKAATAHIKRHKEIPSGAVFTLCSNFPGFDVYIQKQAQHS